MIELYSHKYSKNRSLFKTLIVEWDLIYLIATREIYARFKDSSLGFAWLFFQPLVYVVIMGFFLSLIGRATNLGFSFVLYLFIGIVFFQTIARCMASGSNFLRNKRSLTKQIYIDIDIIVLSSFMQILIDFLIMSSFVIVAFIVLNHEFNLFALMIIPVIIQFILFCLLICRGLSAVATIIPDVALAAPVLNQILFFGTPIFYTLTVIPESLIMVLSLNPLIYFVEISRYILFDYISQYELTPIIISFISTTILMVISYFISQNYKKWSGYAQ